MKYFLFVLTTAFAWAQSNPMDGATEQAKRGEKLFFGSTDNACGSCHEMAGKGAKVGPDLKLLAGLSPRAMITGIEASRTQYVVELKTKDGTFPAMKGTETPAGVEYWDLSQKPPQKKVLAKADISGMSDNNKWKHPPATGMSKQDMADVISYVRWIVKKDRKGISPDDI